MRLILTAAVAAATLLGTLAEGSAQTRRQAAVKQAKVFTPPVIRGRSFLDSGNVVPVGSQANYVTASTTLNQPIYRTFSPDSYGQSALPYRFNNVGRAQPLARFYTPAF